MGSFKIGKVVLQSLFKKPATLMYPVIPRTWQERTRGHIGIVEADCILCGICGKKCPTNAIEVSRDQRTWVIERMQCIQCGCCVEVCPKKCLLMNQEYTAPDAEKIVDRFDIPEQPKPAPKPAAPAAPKPAAEKQEAPAAEKQATPAEVSLEKPAEPASEETKPAGNTAE